MNRIMKQLFGIALIAVSLLLTGCPETESTDSDNSSSKITSLQTVINSTSEGGTINLSEYSDLTDYSAEINKAVTITGSQTNLGNATLIVSASATISGITNANVTTSAELGNGSLKISSSSLSTLTINGGGINSIEIFDVTVDTVSIDKVITNPAAEEYVRLCVDNSTDIGNLNIASSALIDLVGSTFDMNRVAMTFAESAADINVAFRKTIELTTPTGKAKATFSLSEQQTDKDFFIIVNAGKKIVESFFRQASEKIAGTPIGEVYDSHSMAFGFDQTLSAGEHTFSIKPRDKQLYVLPNCNDYDNPLLLCDASSDECVPIRLEEYYSPLIDAKTFSECQDKSGNVYFTIRAEFDDTQNNNGINYVFLLCMIPYGNYEDITDAIILDYNLSTESVEYDYARIAVWDNGDAKRVFVLLDAVDSDDPDKTISSVNIYNVMQTTEMIDNGPMGVSYHAEKVGGRDLNELADKWSFAQAIAVDDNQNIYIAKCSYSIDYSNIRVTDDGLSSPAKASIDKDKSQIYAFKVGKDSTATVERPVIGSGTPLVKYSLIPGIITDVTTDGFSCERCSTRETSSGQPDPKFSFVDLLNSFSFGISDMRYAGDTFVICNELKYMSSIIPEESADWNTVSEGKIMIMPINDLTKATIISLNSDLSLCGPCRVGYADPNKFLIFDNGFIMDDMGSQSDSGVIKINRSTNGWDAMKPNSEFSPYLYYWYGNI